MKLPRFLTKDKTIVYNYKGKSAYEDLYDEDNPREILGKYDDEETVYRDKEGNEIISSGLYYTNEYIPPNSKVVFLEKAMVALKVVPIKNVSNRVSYYKVYLQ